MVSGEAVGDVTDRRLRGRRSDVTAAVVKARKATEVGGMAPFDGQILKYGERGSGFRVRGWPQDYQRLKEKCLREGRLFEDPQFPCSDSSIFYSRAPPRPFEWKRPHELCDAPEFIVEGISRFDVVQGELGDCWLLAAVANLTLNKDLFLRVVPEDQSFGDGYAGIFHFRFWQYGRWIDVVIDDRLPTFAGKLVFMHSSDNTEFWSALLEKAYAKLHGSYESLKGGITSEAMEDFTGGLAEIYEMDKIPPNMFLVLHKAFQRMSLMGCAIEPDPRNPEAILPTGLVAGHAYSITCVKLVEVQTPRVTGKIALLRIRNPWGNEQEWNGAWSDKSPEWTVLSDEEKEEIGLTFSADGEFWMSYKDFVRNFMKLDICNLSPDSLNEESLRDLSTRKWEASAFEGAWTKNCTAGGCRNYLETFATNPQYRVVLEDVDEDDDEELCTLIVALMQKNRRSQRKMGAESLTIGFSIYHLKNPESLPKPLPKEFFKYNASVARSPSFINLREVAARFKLPPGTYCVVPSTFDPNEEGEYILRIFTEKKNDSSEYDEDIDLQKPEQEEEEEEEEVQQQEEKEPTEIDEYFAKLAGEDSEIDYVQLREILNHFLKEDFEFDGFTVEVCRSMVAMMDTDLSGKLGFEEFRKLWSDVQTWRRVFLRYDYDRSGCLNTIELRAALHSAGYRVNLHVLRVLALRYGHGGKVSFEDFMMCAVKLKSMIEFFQHKQTDDGQVTVSKDEWMVTTMYC
ncbi:calpain-B-like isoform X3 [Centruroides sculpturatus]|uniref:calpain-B-like isoform X3 n=1 Tax=Centruroides sculpturatus TaxID=218467 RepID=UPI000C6E30FE|nr:calpain-B-like isoform X3 [Centruroides sculpturatus]